MNHLRVATILAPSAVYVQQLHAANEKRKPQTRILRADLTPEELDPQMADFSSLIADCCEKGRSIRVPAMCGSQWGHVLRALELKREFN